ncbi:hypothetical protein FIBSPDRAFT_956063 [Athelia psychrophila]|uniref:RING-type domain-containing protein n=1 Tax=Athelia psychrophila TaxID=1759441 RepID=A0A166HBN7_9AGAM|nr:hypothetical protein FIBSPDRAFT_956063 [Fibularhizoctonia sp. CBS 109695]
MLNFGSISPFTSLQSEAMLTRPHSRQPSAQPKHKKPLNISAEVIVISDDDEDQTTSIRRQKRKAPGRATPIALEDVLEISDDDDQLMKRRSRALGKTNENLASAGRSSLNPAVMDQINALQLRLSKATYKEAELQAKITELNAKSSLDPELLDDEVSCQLCYTRNWTPYLLPDCGHVSCHACLTSWFSTTLQKHMNTHPTYSPAHARMMPLRTRNLLAQVRQNPDAQNGMLRVQLEMEIIQHRFVQLQAQLAGGPPEPRYECPACRKQVKVRPVEVYPLKAVVQIVGEAMGESRPNEAGPIVAGARPWDGFFGDDLSY